MFCYDGHLGDYRSSCFCVRFDRFHFLFVDINICGRNATVIKQIIQENANERRNNGIATFLPLRLKLIAA